MTKKEIKTKDAPMPTGPYSQGIIFGNRIYVSGQGPLDPATGKVPEGIEEQTRQVLKNIRAILEAGGAQLDNVVKATVHLADLEYFTAFSEVYKTFFKEPYPVRTTVGSKLKDILIEIDVIAELD